MTNTKQGVTKQNSFTYTSLFSGIGGFEQALNKLGGICVFASEIDKYAAQAYETLYGEKPAGDITKIPAEDIPDHDLLVGGFPCQAFSVAGKRKGFEDTRGTLFFEIARIAKEKQPKALLLENVKGLVNHDKGRTLDIMVETLNEVGYVIDFEVLNSKYFGVPQNRERIFIVAIRKDLIETESFNKDSLKGNTVVRKRKREINEWAKTFNFDFPEQTEVTTKLRDILESNVDEKYYLDGEKTSKLVAQLEAKEPTINPNEINVLGNMGRTGHGNFNVFSDEGVGRTVAARDYKDPIRIAEPQMLGHVDIKEHDSIKGLSIREATKKGYTIAQEGDSVNIQFPDSKTRRGRVGKQIANTLEASSINQGVVEKEEIRSVLTSDRLEKHQNGVALRNIIEENVREIASKSRPNEEIEINFKENGDIRPHRTDVKKSGLSELNINHENNPSFTVSATHSPKVYGTKTRYRIRKLTPLECWRLQGFPDEAHEAAKKAGISDSQRYKQAGNAVTVNVVEAIAKRLIPLIIGKYCD